MIGPAWRKIEDYYDLENSNAEYLGYGWRRSSSDNTNSSYNTSLSDNSSYASNDSNESSDLDEQENNLNEFEHELKSYLSDIKETLENMGNTNMRVNLYQILQQSDKSLWMPKSREEFIDHNSAYDATQRIIGEAYKISVIKGDKYHTAFFQNLGTYILHDAFRNSSGLPDNHSIASHEESFKKILVIFLNTFCK